jgi:hypothetical protein
MKAFPPNEIEIVGFNGTMLIECGRALLVAQHKPSHRFFKLSLTNQNRAFFTQQEIAAFNQTGRLTLLPKPMSAESIPGFPRAMAIYAKRELLDAAESNLPKSFLGEPFEWQPLSNDTWAACASVDALEQLMESWGRTVLEKADAVLVDYFTPPDPKRRNPELCTQADRLTELALGAAHKQELRHSIYLRSGIALLFSKTPERLMNLYDFVFRHEFKETTWEHFLESLRKLGDVLQTRATILRNGDSDKADGKVPVAAPAVTESTKKH